MTEPEAKPEAAPVQPTPVPPVPVPPPTIVVKDDDEPSRSTRDILLIISAIGIVISNIIVLYRSEQTNTKVDSVKEHAVRSTEASDKKLDGIHELANANLTKANDSLADVNKQLQDANGRIGKLEQLLIEEKKPEEKPKPEEDP